jgi:hypothetical protein
MTLGSILARLDDEQFVEATLTASIISFCLPGCARLPKPQGGPWAASRRTRLAVSSSTQMPTSGLRS